MVYEVEIEGTLPTYGDFFLSYREDDMMESLALVDNTLKKLIPYFTDMPKLIGDVYTGIVWIRPEMRIRQSSVGYSRKLIMTALNRAALNKGCPMSFRGCYDLGFLFSARSPRTIVLVSNNQDELFNRWDDFRA